MNVVMAGAHQAHALLAGLVTLPREPAPAQPAPAGSGGPAAPGGSEFNFNQFTPTSDVVPKSGFFISIGNGALWLAFALSFAAFACGVLMWVFGPVFGSTYATQAGKTQMWKGLGGVVAAAAAVPLCGFVVGLVLRS